MAIAALVQVGIWPAPLTVLPSQSLVVEAIGIARRRMRDRERR